MDISLYISELLFEHDCVIIPNFGGFICNYKPADIHPVQNTIAPPSKSISFNRNLQTNDGLLVNYIAVSQNISFDAAYDVVSNWVISSKQLLMQKEELRLKNVGRFISDLEGNVQFTPFEEVNYLKSSYGLKTITALPVLHRRGKQIEFTEKFVDETKHAIEITRSTWRIAATVLLLISLVAFAELMWMGVSIKPLQLNEASVFGFIENVFKTPTPEFKPIAIEVVSNTTTEVNRIAQDTVTIAPDAAINETTSTSKEESYTPSVSNGPTYYIVIGAFGEQKNVEAAKRRLQQRFPDSVIYEDRGRKVTRLGYSIGTDYNKAMEQLDAAKAEDSSYWLLKK
ncbi:MAG: hypothetical protein KA149_02085 [Chitinophagales bacterium]|nr:hypothetical protein [Chitinophagales bacterium]